jgi:peptidoglycan/LPS O-acetylase OafA/YrhL
MKAIFEQPTPAGGASVRVAMRSRYPAIDALRALAALMVLIFHVIVLGRWDDFPAQGVGAVLRNGWVGVDLFFLISGFVISLAALHGHDVSGKAFRGPFVRRRLARIVPLYFLSGMVFLFCTKPELLDVPVSEWGARVASFLLFVQNLHPHWHGAINGPSWSVALEMQYYLMVLCITPWLARVRGEGMVVAALLLAAGYRLATTLVLVPGSAQISEQFVFLSQLPGVIDEFALGMLLALAVRRGQGRLARALLPSWRNFFAWAAAAVVLLAAAASLFQRFGYWDSRTMLVAWRPLLSMGLCALLASAIAYPKPQSGWLAPARYAGTVSYGLYLWHFPVLVALTMRAPGISGAVLLLWTLAATTLLAIFSWHFIEKPLIERHKGQPNGHVC